MTATTSYRLALGLTAFTALFLLYGIGALGIIGAGGEPDRLYVAVLAVLVAGSVLARLRPSGMAAALAATAIATTVVGLVAIAAGYHDEPGASVLEILGLSAMYAGLFALAAWLFRRSSTESRATAARA